MSEFFVAYDPFRVVQNARIIYWARVSDICVSSGSKKLSIHDYLEENSQRIKEKFNYYIDDIYASKFTLFWENYLHKGRNFPDLWQLSRFSELANVEKSKSFNDVLKSIALKDYLTNSGATQVTLLGFPYEISLLIQSVLGNEVRVLLREVSQEVKLPTISFFKNIFVVSYYFLVYAFISIFFQNKSFFIAKKSYVFVDYITNSSTEFITHKKSSYWGELPKKLEDFGFNIRYVHIFSPSSTLRFLPEIIRKINEFNDIKENHIFLNSVLSIHDIVLALLRTIYVWIMSWLFRLLNRKVFLTDRSLNIEWTMSFESYELFLGFCYVRAFQKIFKDSCGEEFKAIYVCENQAWEYALNNALAKCSGSFSCASLQTYPRFWDLRFLNNLQRLHTASQHSARLPNIITHDTQEIPAALQNTCKSILYPVESYRNFINIRNGRKVFHHERPLINKIIVAGEYSDRMTQELLEIVLDFKEINKFKLPILYKAHPASGFNFRKFFNFKFDEINFVDMSDCDALVVCDANSTFSSLCFAQGMLVACYINRYSLNLSPMYEEKFRNFFSSSEELNLMFCEGLLDRSGSKPAVVYDANLGVSKWMRALEGNV